MKIIYGKLAISLFLTLLVILILLFLYGNTITITGFVLVIALAIVILPLFYVKDLFHPFVLLTLSTGLVLINFIDHNINGEALRYSIGFSHEYIDYAVRYSLIIFIVWYIAFYLGFFINGKTKKTNSQSFIKALHRPKLVAFCLIVTSMLGFFAIINILGGVSSMLNAMVDTTRNYAGLGYFRSIVSLGGIAALVLLYAGKLKISIIVLLITCVMLSAFGGRGAIVLGTLLPFLMVYNYKIKKISPVLLICFAFLAFIFVLIWEQMRRYGRINLSDIPKENILTSVAGNTRMADILPSLVGNVLQGNIDFLWGKPLINIIYSPIPRSLWEGKPEIIDETVLIGSLLLGESDFYGLPAGPYGWAFLNFGWFGVIIMGLLTGLIVSKVYNMFIMSRDSSKESFVGVILYVLIIRQLFNLFATSAQINIIWILLIFVIIYSIDLVSRDVFSKGYKLQFNSKSIYKY
ncbi:oligosaccharide repeat unit polymerase [Alkalihalobacillus xiaoxiensis]|uniref:Oligosaccharide repeat unit polymerase n=1 Tax=Shouchella xiaoxiensis TaxID=766895 RepID=A0ABS2SWN4_9BACI|nr:O-antigen polymerase [Shouchella xiaoxiensis]MBM7839411.1 oligosaccharide repeat unit polymerase [Shouchella xiaoxiensis]